MKKINKNNIKLYDTITCGQIFRYIIDNDKYTIILNDRVVELYEDDIYLYVKSNNEDCIDEIINKYLDLNRDYNSINNNLIKKDPTLKSIIDECCGFKIINSYPFETIISYMISANNNVKNITRIVNKLSENYGKKVIFNNKIYYLFPTLNEMKNITLDEYKGIGLGFRSQYIYDFINNINEFDIDNIYNMSTNNALEYLMNFKGIGLKIASCILLFAYRRFDVFPIDTWVKKYMMDLYSINDIKKIKELTLEKYNEYSGLVIQYMFHSKRNKT